jgi:hypothetical protein
LVATGVDTLRSLVANTQQVWGGYKFHRRSIQTPNLIYFYFSASMKLVIGVQGSLLLIPINYGKVPEKKIGGKSLLVLMFMLMS